MHNSLDGFGFQPDPTTDYGVTYPERLKNLCIMCEHSSTLMFDWIFFILAGNEDNHKVSNEIKIRPDPTLDSGVSCPWASEKNPYRLTMGEMM